MNLDILFVYIAGYERIADGLYRLYVDGPVPKPQFHRRTGQRMPLFHLFAGRDAERVEAWLARNRTWQCLRVPNYTREQGVRAVLTASRWRECDGSAIAEFGRGRLIRDEDHRERLRKEVELLVGMVLENPVKDGELAELHELQDTINAGPVGIELATTGEVVAAHFGTG